MERTESGWKFGVTDPAFEATFGIEIFGVPESGDPPRAEPDPPRRRKARSFTQIGV